MFTVEEVSSGTIVADNLFAHVTPDKFRIVVIARFVSHCDDTGTEIDARRGNGAMQIVRECCDAAASRQMIANESNAV